MINMSVNLMCYVCKQEFKQDDLIIPMNIDMIMQSGRMSLAIYLHYMCGLNFFLDNLDRLSTLTDKDRVAIEGRLMEAMNSISKGTIQ